MLVKVICLNFESAYGGFNDESVRDFVKDKEIISISDYLFVRNEVPYLALIIKYYPLRQEINSTTEPQPRKDESWRQLEQRRPELAGG